MKRCAAAIASERAYGLAEGPVWDPPRDRVLWVDINAGNVHAGTLHRDTVRTPAGALAHLEETVSAVVVSDDGELLVAGARSLFALGPDGSALSTSS